MAIKLNFSALGWRIQLGAFTGLAAIGVGVFWYMYADPMRADLDQRRSALAKIKNEINRGLKTAQRLPEFRQEVAALESQLEGLRTQLPEEQDVADLLRRVQGMATESNLTIRGFTPQPVTRKDLHAEWPIGISVEGTYHDLGAFLERVSKFPRIINVGNINITARETQTAAATVSADCTATAFVLVAQEEKAAAKPKPGKGAKAAKSAKA
jgi:type IV pilus assembly protein PilO